MHERLWQGVKSFQHLIQVTHVGTGHQPFHILIVGSLLKDHISSFFQCVSVSVRESSIASFDKIMVEGGVGVLWRADGHNREVKIIDGVGGDRGGDMILLPLLVRLSNQDSSPDESKADN